MTANEPAPRAGHPYYMHDAIFAQPGAPLPEELAARSFSWTGGGLGPAPA